MIKQIIFGLTFVLCIPLIASESKSDSKVSDEKTATFKAILQLYDIIEQAVDEVNKDDSLTFLPNEVNRLGWPGPNPYYAQTKAGLFVAIAAHPKYLMTPWGNVLLFGNTVSSPSASKKITKMLMTRLQSKCVGHVAEMGSSELKDDKKGYGVHEINKLGDIALPKPELLLDRSNYRSYETIKDEWKQLTLMHPITVIAKKPVPPLRRQDTASSDEESSRSTGLTWWDGSSIGRTWCGNEND